MAEEYRRLTLDPGRFSESDPLRSTEVEYLARRVYYCSHSEPFTGAITEIEELLTEVIKAHTEEKP